MRTTLRLDDDLLNELKRRAAAQKVSFSKLINVVLRAGLAKKPEKAPPYREKTFSMGAPRVNLDKALQIAAALENDEIARKLVARK